MLVLADALHVALEHQNVDAATILNDTIFGVHLGEPTITVGKRPVRLGSSLLFGLRLGLPTAFLWNVILASAHTPLPDYAAVTTARCCVDVEMVPYPFPPSMIRRSGQIIRQRWAVAAIRSSPQRATQALHMPETRA